LSNRFTHAPYVILIIYQVSVFYINLVDGKASVVTLLISIMSLIRRVFIRNRMCTHV
jgi:hypothetical protein